jgi:aminopeptidase N
MFLSGKVTTTFSGQIIVNPDTSANNAGTAKPRQAIQPDDCHAEGKDILCGHFKATVARLLAEEADAVRAGAHAEEYEDIDVTHCFLDIELEPVTETLSGTNALTVTSLVNNLTTLTLDLRDNMVVDNVTMTGLPVAFTRPGHKVEITLDQVYDTGESFEVVVAYHGSPEDIGFASFRWSIHDGTKLAATLSQPWYAHTWWPCKDALGDKFTMDIWVTVPDWMVVASNGLLQGTDSVGGGKLRYRWYESYPIITYLVSLAATNYTHWTEYYDHAGGSMPVEFYSYPENLSWMQAGVADVVEQIETFSLSEVFGEYPFINEKYGIAQFAGTGGMEHQTITSQSTFLWWLNAHELAHQWWGDMITCGTWHDIWLNEGFATYSEAVYQEKRPGGSFADYLSRMLERKPSSYGGSVYVYDANSLSAVFSSNNVYKKGAWVLHMLRHVVGDETFFGILAAYRAAYEGGSAITDDLRAIAESVYGDDLGWFFSEWVYGVGAPYYRYGWQYEQVGYQHEVRLHVEQYQTSYPKFRMPIDITVTTDSGSETNVIWQDRDIQWYVLPANGPVTNVQFDKDTWILRGDAADVGYQPPVGDIDADGDVDWADFAAFASYWMQTGCGLCGGADLTGDGNVDWEDAAELVKNWLAGK